MEKGRQRTRKGTLKYPQHAIGEKIHKRLAAFAEALEKSETITERFTCRRIELDLQPEPYNPELVKKTRAALGVSQALFAQFLGVSVKAVSAWERGARAPSDMACRFMDEIRHDPAYWQGRLRKIARPKTSV